MGDCARSFYRRDEMELFLCVWLVLEWVGASITFHIKLLKDGLIWTLSDWIVKGVIWGISLYILLTHN